QHACLDADRGPGVPRRADPAGPGRGVGAVAGRGGRGVVPGRLGQAPGAAFRRRRPADGAGHHPLGFLQLATDPGAGRCAGTITLGRLPVGPGGLRRGLVRALRRARMGADGLADRLGLAPGAHRRIRRGGAGGHRLPLLGRGGAARRADARRFLQQPDTADRGAAVPGTAGRKPPALSRAGLCPDHRRHHPVVTAAAHMSASDREVPLLSYGSLAASMFVVGACVALSKPLVAVFPVFLLGWLRFGIGGAGMLHWLRRPASEPAPTLRVRLLVFLEAFIGSFLFTVFMVLGVSYSGAVAAGVVMSAIPAAIAVLSRVVLRETIRPRVLAAILCAVSGIALLALARPGTGG